MPAVPPESPPPARDLGWLVLLAICWGSAFPVIRFGLLAGASPLALGAARFALAFLLLAGISLVQRPTWPGRRTLLISAVFGGVVTVGAYAAFLNTGEETVSGGLAAVLIATGPLWTVLFSWVVLPGERITLRAGLGLFVGLLGVLVLFLPEVLSGFGSNGIGETWVVAAAAAGTGGGVMLRRLIPGGVGLWSLTVQFGVASVVLALASGLPGEGWALPATASAWEAVVYLAVVPSVIGYTIFFGLMHRGGVTRAILVTYLNPIVGIAVGVALLAEAVTFDEITGFLLIVGGLALFDWNR